MEPVDELYATGLLIDQLKDEDSQLRINAIRNLTNIARFLGPDKTKVDLLKYIEGFFYKNCFYYFFNFSSFF